MGAERMEDQDATVRCLAIQAVSFLVGPVENKFTRLMAAQLNDPDWEVRHEAMMTLGRVDCPKPQRTSCLWRWSEAMTEHLSQLKQEASLHVDLTMGKVSI